MSEPDKYGARRDLAAERKRAQRRNTASGRPTLNDEMDRRREQEANPTPPEQRVSREALLLERMGMPGGPRRSMSPKRYEERQRGRREG